MLFTGYWLPIRVITWNVETFAVNGLTWFDSDPVTDFFHCILTTTRLKNKQLLLAYSASMKPYKILQFGAKFSHPLGQKNIMKVAAHFYLRRT